MGSFFLWSFIGCFIFVNGAEIENARALITGGANGIGYACAYDLLRRGARAVAILDLDLINGMAAAVKLNNQFGIGRAFFLLTDIFDQSLFRKDFELAVKILGGLDIMINDAEIPFDPTWGQEIDTNIKGQIQGTLMSFDVMGKHKGGKGGTVINIASISSFVPFKDWPGYATTKLAVLGFSRSIAMSYNVTGVAVKTMCPGDTNTQLIRSKASQHLDLVDYDGSEGNMENINLQERISLFFGTFLDRKSILNSFADQKPDAVSCEIMRMIEEAPNGAIWVVENDEPTISLNIPNYREWGTPV